MHLLCVLYVYHCNLWCDNCLCCRRLLLHLVPWIACFWTKRPHTFPNFWGLLHSGHSCFLHLSKSFIWKCGSYTCKVFYCTLANYINNHHPAKVVTLYALGFKENSLGNLQIHGYEHYYLAAGFGTMCSEWYSSTSQLQFCHHLGEPPAHRPVGNSGLKG